MQMLTHMKRSAALSLLIFLVILTGCSREEAGQAEPAESPAASHSPIASAAPVVSGTPAEAGLTKEQKLEDFEYLYKVLEENYPFFEVNKRVHGVDWLANKEQYAEKVQAAPDDLQFYGALNEILAELHNGHTYMLDRGTYQYFREIHDNVAQYKPWSDILQLQKVKDRYGESDAETGSGAAGAAAGSVDADDMKAPNLLHRTLEPDKSAYLWIKSFATENTEEDGKVIAKFLDQIKDYKTLILDIRGNGGGDQMYWIKNIVAKLTDRTLPYKEYMLFREGTYQLPFLASRGITGSPVSELDPAELPKMPPEAKTQFKSYLTNTYGIRPEPIGFKGEIYLLVDRNVYSSSESLAAYAKSTGFATLIGEQTGGDGIGTTPLIAALPNSGYVLNFPFVLGLTADGSANDEFKTTPDYTVPAERNRDWHKDPAIQKALELSESD
jgi:C-terminal processing protease CtpA/Prc